MTDIPPIVTMAMNFVQRCDHLITTEDSHGSKKELTDTEIKIKDLALKVINRFLSGERHM